MVNAVATAVEIGVFLFVLAYFVSLALSKYNVSTVKGNFSADQQSIIGAVLVLSFLSIGLYYIFKVKKEAK